MTAKLATKEYVDSLTSSLVIPPINCNVWLRLAQPAYINDIGNNNNNRVITFIDGSSTGIMGSAIIPSPNYDYQVVLRFGMSTSLSSKAVVIQLYGNNVEEGDVFYDPSSWDFSSPATINTRSDTAITEVRNSILRFPKSMFTGTNRTLFFSLFRVGANVADTHTGNLYLENIWLEAI